MIWTKEWHTSTLVASDSDVKKSPSLLIRCHLLHRSPLDLWFTTLLCNLPEGVTLEQDFCLQDEIMHPLPLQWRWLPLYVRSWRADAGKHKWLKTKILFARIHCHSSTRLLVILILKIVCIWLWNQLTILKTMVRFSEFICHTKLQWKGLKE